MGSLPSRLEYGFARALCQLVRPATWSPSRVTFALDHVNVGPGLPTLPGRRDGATFTRGKASMLNFNINLTSLAIILWSGMLVIAGSIWVLSSQVRKLADIMEDHSRSSAPLERVVEASVAASPVRVARRGAATRI